MWDKRRYATHVVSNLTFDPAVLSTWVRRMRGARHHHAAAARPPGPGRPHQAAVDGRQDRRRRVDALPVKHKGTFARLAAPGGFTGEKFLQKCAAELSAPEMGVEGVHVFTFNQVAETEKWRAALLDQLRSRR